MASRDIWMKSHSKEVKSTRKLLWKRTVGIVNMTVQLADREMKFSVSPVHAAILHVHIGFELETYVISTFSLWYICLIMFIRMIIISLPS